MKSVVLSDGNTTAIRPSETSYLHTVDGSKDVLAPILRVQEGNFAFVTLEIEIVVHNKTFLLVKKKTV